jgi:IS30 family transposase
MKTYTHLNHDERDKLAISIHQGQSLRSIARELGRHPSTLKRELERNYGPKIYTPHQAHERAMKRHHLAHQRPRLKSNALRHDVEALIMKKKWSPEIISGRLNKEGKHPPISHEAIYQWIYSDAPHLIPYLVRQHKQRFPKHHSRKHRKPPIPERVSILERPSVIDSRKYPGHWETDQVVGKGPQSLQVLVERKSRFTKLKKNQDKTAEVSSQSLIAMLSSIPEDFRKSITYDNGSENFKHQDINIKFGMRSFFCEPFHSWEKGSTENRNGLIRRFIPKGTDLSTIPEELIQFIEDWLNNRPMKCLKFDTPAEVLNSFGVALNG